MVSHLSGIWDTTIFGVLGVIFSLMVLRWQPFTSFILASSFDFVIPAQHFREPFRGSTLTTVHPVRLRIHKAHLGGYIPCWFVITLTELVLVASAPIEYAPTVIAIKSIVMFILWLTIWGNRFVGPMTGR